MSLPADGTDSIWAGLKTIFDGHFEVGRAEGVARGKEGQQADEHMASPTLAPDSKEGASGGGARSGLGAARGAAAACDSGELLEKREAVVDAVRWAWKVT